MQGKDKIIASSSIDTLRTDGQYFYGLFLRFSGYAGRLLLSWLISCGWLSLENPARRNLNKLCVFNHFFNRMATTIPIDARNPPHLENRAGCRSL